MASFSVPGRSRQDHVGNGGTAIAVMSDVDDERIFERLALEFVGGEKKYRVDRARARAFDYVCGVPATGLGHEAEIEAADPGCRNIEHPKAVPGLGDRAECRGDPCCRTENRFCVAAHKSPGSDDDERFGGPRQGRVACLDTAKGFRCAAQTSHGIGKIVIGSDRRDGKSSAQPSFPQPGVDDRGFTARIGADQEAGVGLLDTRDRAVEEP